MTCVTSGMQVALLMEMLNLEPWSFFPLTLQFLSTVHEPLRKGLPIPPEHIRVDFAPVDVRSLLPEACCHAITMHPPGPPHPCTLRFCSNQLALC